MKAILTKVADLSPELSGLDVLHFGVGARGEALVAAAKPEDAKAFEARLEQPGRASFPETRTDAARELVVVVHDGESARRLSISNEVLAFPHVQTAPSDRLLVVGPRCRRFPDGTAELNGRLYTSDCQLEREILMGDGIAHVQVTEAGKVWVAYYDEGIFGNFGWGNGVDSTPIGSSGLVRFDLSGRREWEFTPPQGFDAMADCYALNVASDDETWVCYYLDFPLVHIGPGNSLTGWRTGLSGVDAIAADGDKVLLFGGYQGDRHRCRIGRLDAGRVVALQDVELDLETGAGLDSCRFAGRGRALHALADLGWFRLEITDVSRG